MSNEEIAISISRELLIKIDQSRGSLSREKFVSLCVDTFLSEGAERAGAERYATIEEFEEFQRKMGKLQGSFIEFLITYGLELGR